MIGTSCCASCIEQLNVLLCISGYVTKNRLKSIVDNLHSLSDITEELHIRLVLSEKSRYILEDSIIMKLVEKVYTDDDEWSQWKGLGDGVLHIDLTKWADIMVLAPLDVNTMTKIAIGICDDLLTCTTRAWNLSKPIIFCPAISSSIRNQDLTKSHISILQTWGYKEISPGLNNTINSGNEYPMAEPKAIRDMIILLVGKDKK